MTNPTELIQRYFERAAATDTDSYLDQFTPDAVAQDDGSTYEGIDQIRVWRGNVPPVTYATVGIDIDTDESVARAEIAGDFPGSPVSLGFHFVFAPDGRIRTLAVRP